jgi:hypothetical protein
MNLYSLSKLYKTVHEKIEQHTCPFIGNVVFSYLIDKEHDNLVFKPYAPQNASSYGMEYDRNYTARYSFAYKLVQQKKWSHSFTIVTPRVSTTPPTATSPKLIYREDLLYALNYKQYDNRYLLAILYKKNGKHRYYIIKETDCSACTSCGQRGCSGQYCRGNYEYDYSYKPHYVGQDRLRALALFTLLMI